MSNPQDTGVTEPWQAAGRGGIRTLQIRNQQRRADEFCGAPLF